MATTCNMDPGVYFGCHRQNQKLLISGMSQVVLLARLFYFFFILFFAYYTFSLTKIR
jgi:hypothetical protein